MYYIKWITLTCIIAINFLIPGCSTNTNISESEISDKYKFIICEINSIISNLEKCDNKIPMSGSFGYNTFSKKELNDVLLYNNFYIDPFLQGESKVTVKNWKWPGEDWIPKEMTMYGSPLNYWQDEKGYIILCFAGPDQSIGTKQDIVFVKNYNADEVFPTVKYYQYVVEYDPTNGMKSNGDIIFIYNTGKDNRMQRLITNDSVYLKFLSTQRTWDDGSWIFQK